MSMMGVVSEQKLQWYAVRVKRKQVGGIRKVTIGGDYLPYKGRGGVKKWRHVKGSGESAFVPEVLLRKAGFEVFLPVRKELKRKNRFTEETHAVAYPLLVDWIFVGWSVDLHEWHRLMGFDVVTGVLGVGGQPIRIKSDVVTKLMRRWGGGHLSPNCYRYMKSAEDFSEGQIVQVNGGLMDGKDVQVTQVSRNKIKWMTNLLGVDVVGESIPGDLTEIDQDRLGVTDAH